MDRQAGPDRRSPRGERDLLRSRLTPSSDGTALRELDFKCADLSQTAHSCSGQACRFFAGIAADGGPSAV